MRTRKLVALFGAIIVFSCCVYFYQLADQTLFIQDDSAQRFMSRKIVKGQIKKEPVIKIGLNDLTMQAKPSKRENGSLWTVVPTCHSHDKTASADVEMFEVYKSLKFDNIDGGVWKQGWDVQITPGKWNPQNTLKVFVVPHSHNDPGWLRTFEDYYILETRNIFRSMLQSMSEDSRKRFIWAEVSFLSLWWDELSQEDQEKLKRLVHNKQLEIVTGGWVMNDEANSHFYSIITQLSEGHLWLQSNLRIKPRNAWTVDPFGESPVMPYLFRKMEIDHLVVQRVHYSIKKYLAQTKNLEFRWKQLWDDNGNHNLLTHVMPFYSYDIPHTCGPNPKVCCQFDFERLPGYGLICPWRVAPKPINQKNVASRAELLLNQYKKKAELFRSNVVLVPLGDDFRYQTGASWENQFENYYKLMDYINTKPDLHATVQFGTLADYFDALMKELPTEDFPTLTGDFFTYADRDDHYWSGYYTSRPFYKKLDRILIGYHRAAEIIFALSWGNKKINESTDWLLSPITGFAKTLREVRRSLSLFQHHDGVTGTARDVVMQDYAKKMIDAINHAKHIIQQCSYFLLSLVSRSVVENTEGIYFEFDDHRRNTHALPDRKLLIFNGEESKKLVFFNSLTSKRKHVASIQVFIPQVKILKSDGTEVPCQISPVFSQEEFMDETRYEVFFPVEVPALGLASYTVVWYTNEEQSSERKFSKVGVFNALGAIRYSSGFRDVDTMNRKEFILKNQFLEVKFNENGFIRSILNKETKMNTSIQLDFVRYLARKKSETSGAYLFLPEGQADLVRVRSPLIHLFEGPIYSRIVVHLHNVKHTVTIYNSSIDDGGVEIINLVDIKNENNYELAMRITSSVSSGDDFYTDLNGFQMIQRKRFKKLPLQGNFYPMPTAAYIEDRKTRLTVVSGQPLGVSSLSSGELEILQDRRLSQDDQRGLGQGVLDNKPTPNLFRILIETKLEACQSTNALLSPKAHHSLQDVLFPVIKMIWKSDATPNLRDTFAPVSEELESSIQLVSVRTLDEETYAKIGMVFHRTYLDKCLFSSLKLEEKGVINIDSFLPNHFGDIVRNSSLSFTTQYEALDRGKDHTLCYMDFLSLMVSG